MVRILFVCLGNICRSPTAEGVMRRMINDAGLSDRISVASAGTGGWHVGEPPDARATSAAAARGVELTGASQQVTRADFDRYDLLVAMDRTNQRALLELALPDDRHKIHLLGEYGSDPARPDVPDPYYGGDHGFETVLDIVEAGCRGLLNSLTEELV